MPIKDFQCNIINGNFACWAKCQMSLLGNNVTLCLWPWVTLLPLGDIWCVTLHGSHHLYNISQQTHKLYKKCHNWSHVLCTEQNAILIHQQHMLSDYCTNYEQNQHILFCNITTNTHHLWIDCLNYSDWAQRQFYLCTPQTMVPDHTTKYEENPSSHHGGQMDGQMDWRTGRIHIVLILLLQSGECWAGNNKC